MKTNIPGLFLCSALLPGAFFSAGCFGVEKGYVEKRRFVLEATRPEAKSPRADGPVLRILRLEVSPHCQGRGFVYRRDDLSYESDFYNEFFIDPGTLVAGKLRGWLEASGLFAHVTESSGPLDCRYTLLGHLAALYGDFRADGPPAAVMEMQFMLLDDRDGSPRILLKRDYGRSADLEGGSPEGLAAGWSRALSEILSDLEADLRDALAGGS